MVIFADGTSIGAISGGCLESDVVERSGSVFDDGIPKMLRYNATAEEDDVVFGLGMGCNGVTTIFLERLQGADDPLCGFVRQCFDRSERGIVATVYEIEAAHGRSALMEGHRFFLYHHEEAGDNFGESPFANRLRKYVWNTAATMLGGMLPKPQNVRFEDEQGTAHILFERIEPLREVVIMGAGYDALPLVEYASVLGWRVNVCDHRPALLTAERLPKATTRTRTTRETTSETVRNLAFQPNTAVVIMTHNLALDAAVLKEALRSDAGYIGLLGPKPRLAKILTHLKEEGAVPTKDEMLRLHNPIGLDIGSETAEEVALSIIAEIQAVMHQRSGGFLQKQRRKKIH
jgi:xanthine/CO dehydrogenase XdhC/CoxF family maturation factor